MGEVTRFVLMYKPHAKGTRWQPIGTPGTFSACVALIGSGGRRGGKWWIKRVDAGSNPFDETSTEGE